MAKAIELELDIGELSISRERCVLFEFRRFQQVRNGGIILGEVVSCSPDMSLIFGFRVGS